MSKPENIRVVIQGQDPFPQILPNGKPRALGFSFSVSKEDVIPSSLHNIYKEIKNNYPDSIIPSHGDISHWVTQGLFLHNACLTCRVVEPGSHNKYKLWMPFFDRFLKYLSTVNKDVIFVLWGKEAQQYETMIEKGFRNILRAVHPSGLSASRGFFGCGHFKQINDIIRSQKGNEIKWLDMEKPLSKLYIEYFSKEIKEEEMTSLKNYYKEFYDKIENKEELSLEEYTITMITHTVYSQNVNTSEKKITYEEYLKIIREKFEKENKENFYSICLNGFN
jgi:uracil-DNA glycosylase